MAARIHIFGGLRRVASKTTGAKNRIPVAPTRVSFMRGFGGSTAAASEFSSSSSSSTAVRTQWATTGLDIPGCRIVENKGLVTGVVVRGRNIIVDTVGRIQALFGGNLSIYSDMCNTARQEAMTLMLQHAADIGGNAVVGVRFDTGTMLNATEVLCYGTAVVVVSR